MKTISRISILILSLFLVTFTSCEVEPLDSGIDLTDDNGNNGGGNNGGGGTSSGDYWPLAVNNVWNYSDDGAPSEPMKIISTSVINGKTYHNFDTMFGQGDVVSASIGMRARKSGGDYFLKIDDFTFDLFGMTASITGFEMVLFKDNLEVNQTWSGNFTQTTTFTGMPIPAITQSTSYIGTILEKNISVQVGSTTYNNVIKSKIVQTVVIPDTPDEVTETFYWFAKDVGVIKVVSDNDEGVPTESILTSYTLN